MFRASISAYVVLCGIWVLLAVGYVFLSIHTGRPQYVAIVISLVPAVLFGFWLWQFRLDFVSDGVVYRSLFAGRRFVPYCDVIGESFISRGLFLAPNRSKLKLRSGEELEINWKVFPIEASKLFHAHMEGT